jgi:hypothetical protein
MLKRKIARGFLILSVLFMAVACSGPKTHFHKLRPLPEPKICRLAVLPFTIDDQSVSMAHSVALIFQAVLAASDDYEFVQEGDILAVFHQLKVIPGSRQPRIEEMQIIGNYLNVQYLITGHILKIGEEMSADRGVYPFLALQMSLIEAATGETVWTSYSRKKGDEKRVVLHFGLINSSTQLAGLMAQEIVSQWAAEGFTAQCIE